MAQSSYYTGWLISEDTDLRVRIAAAAQQQADQAQVEIGDPEVWAAEHRWQYATAPGWVGKVMSAMESGVLAWGRDPSVITDQDILSWTQPEIAGP